MIYHWRCLTQWLDTARFSDTVWPPDMKNWLIGKDLDAGKDCGQEQKGTTDDEMVGWHHRINGHEFEQAPGVDDGQGSLTCCSPWGRKELDMTERLSNKYQNESHQIFEILILLGIIELLCTQSRKTSVKHFNKNGIIQTSISKVGFVKTECASMEMFCVNVGFIFSSLKDSCQLMTENLQLHGSMHLKKHCVTMEICFRNELCKIIPNK